jgi:predicted metallo-beta-lactamase superfamily hydrolase
LGQGATYYDSRTHKTVAWQFVVLKEMMKKLKEMAKALKKSQKQIGRKIFKNSSLIFQQLTGADFVKFDLQATIISKTYFLSAF